MPSVIDWLGVVYIASRIRGYVTERQPAIVAAKKNPPSNFLTCVAGDICASYASEQSKLSNNFADKDHPANATESFFFRKTTNALSAE
jgi:hypothetical protein